MIGGFRFAIARARAAMPSLVALAAVSALAALLTLGLASASATIDTREVRDALASMTPDRSMAQVSVDDGAAVARAAG